MVFESIVGPLRAERKPWEMALLGALFSSFALVVAYYIFKDDVSLVTIFLTTLAAVPVTYNAIRMEEKKDVTFKEEKTLLREHSSVVTFLMCYFVGVAVAMSLWFVFLSDEVRSMVFAAQLRDIARIELASQFIGYSIMVESFFTILFHNARVLLIAILFSFFYGAGSLFILTWNASVIAAATGTFVLSAFSHAPFAGVLVGLARYLVHGVPEMAAYFIGALAGGIISVAIIRHDLEPKKTGVIMRDALVLFSCAVGLLIFAAAVEVWITPLIFG